MIQSDVLLLQTDELESTHHAQNTRQHTNSLISRHENRSRLRLTHPNFDVRPHVPLARSVGRLHPTTTSPHATCARGARTAILVRYSPLPRNERILNIYYRVRVTPTNANPRTLPAKRIHSQRETRQHLRRKPG